MARISVNHAHVFPKEMNPDGTIERLLQLVPGDRDARLALVAATFEPYARNLEVKPEDVEKQRDAAEKLFFEKPDEGQPLRTAVQFRMLNAAHANQNGDKAAAADEIAKATALGEQSRKIAPGLADAWMAGYETVRGSAALVDPKDTPKLIAVPEEPSMRRPSTRSMSSAPLDGVQRRPA